MSETSGSTVAAPVLGGVAVLLAGSYLRYAVVRGATPGTVLEGGLAMVGPAGLVYAAVTVAAGRQRDGRLLVSRSLLGVGAAVALGAVYLASQAVQGVSVPRPAALLHVAASAGTVGGLAVAVRERRLRRRVDRLERHEETFVFLNNTLRHNVLNSTQIIQGQAAGFDGPPAESIGEHCDRIADIVQDVGVLSEVLAGEVDTGVVNLSAVVAAEVQVARERWPDADIEADVPPGVRVEADQFLGLVCENLLDNAIDHNDKPTPEVEVTVDPRDDGALLRVADNGPGVEDPATALERGTRGDRGVGLYLVRTLVEGYGGDVAVTDNEPEGAVFAVELPAASGEPKDSFRDDR